MTFRALPARIALLLALSLALGAWLWRPALALYHLEAGGQDLVDAEAFRSTHPTADNQLLDRALRHFQQAVALSPADGYAYRRLGQAWLLAGNNNGAQAALSKAAALRPHDPLIHIELGEAWSAIGDADKAVAEYEQGRYGPAVADAVVNYLKLADWRIAAGSGDVALKILQDKVLPFDPDNLGALAKVAAVYQSMGQSGAAAAAPIRTRLGQFTSENIAVPVSPAAAGELAQGMIALTEDGTWTRNTLLNVAGYQVWQFSAGATGAGTEQLLQTLVNHWPQDADLLFDLGEFYQRRGDYASAEARYRQVLVLAPGYTPAMLRLDTIAPGSADGKPTPIASEDPAELDLADRTAAADALQVPVTQIELGANLLPAISSAVGNETTAAGWHYNVNPGPAGNDTLVANGPDDLVLGARSFRIDSLWRKEGAPNTGPYAEYASKKFGAGPDKYLITVQYSLDRAGQGTGLVFWGEYDIPGGLELLQKPLLPTAGQWATQRFTVAGPKTPTQTGVLLRNWSDGTLIVTDASIRQIKVVGHSEP